VPGLFIADGSTVNGPLGVNPQVTIMAMSERAATFVERRLETHTTPLRKNEMKRASPTFEFTETMSGHATFLETGRRAEAAFTVRCLTHDAGGLFSRLFDAAGGQLTLVGETTIEGFATKQPSTGTLAMHPMKRRGTLVYDLDFTADDGVRYHLHGEKNVPLTGVLSGMTELIDRGRARLRRHARRARRAHVRPARHRAVARDVPRSSHGLARIGYPRRHHANATR
jgi:hypothetical protein